MKGALQKLFTGCKFNWLDAQDLLVFSETKKIKESGKRKGLPGIFSLLGLPKHHESIVQSFMGCLKYWCHPAVISSSVIELAYSLMGKANKHKNIFWGLDVLSVFGGVTQEHHFFGQYSLGLRGEKSHLACAEDKSNQSLQQLQWMLITLSLILLWYCAVKK